LALIPHLKAQGGADNPPPPPPVVLTDEQGQYPLGLYLELLSDPTRQLTIEEVTSPDYEAQFVASREEVPNFGYTTSAIWRRFRIRNEARQKSQWLLSLHNSARIGEIDLYLLAPDGERLSHQQAGSQLPFTVREIRYPQFVTRLRVPLPTGAEGFIHLGLQSATATPTHYFSLSSILSLLLFSLALADKINLLKRKTEQSHRDLRESENRLNQFLEAMPVGVTVHDVDGKAHYINRRAQQIFGLSDEVVQSSKQQLKLVPSPKPFLIFRSTWRAAKRNIHLSSLPLLLALGGKSTTADDLEVELSGKRIPLEIWSRPIFDEQDTLRYAISAFQDISQRKQAEVELKEYREHLEELVTERMAELAEAKRSRRSR